MTDVLIGVWQAGLTILGLVVLAAVGNVALEASGYLAHQLRRGRR